MARELRRPAEPADFDALELPRLKKTLSAPWWNLRWAAHATKSQYFHAALTGRLTPGSGTVPCLYLARDRETSFQEIYGDDIYIAGTRKLGFRLAKTDLEHRVYLKTAESLALTLYDLTTVRGAKRIGMDLGTLYAADISCARDFAQRLHDHPAKFDGILYESRHTKSRCIVVWATHRPALKKLELATSHNLWELATPGPAVPPGALKIFGTVIQVASAGP